MSVISMILIGLVGLLHCYIMWFEMFAWESRGPKIFKGFPRDLFAQTKAMGANQGLYNGFLAAGLFWSLLIGDPAWASNIALFFLICVFVAGAYGALTVTKRIFLFQGVPSALGIAAVLFT